MQGRGVLLRLVMGDDDKCILSSIGVRGFWFPVHALWTLDSSENHAAFVIDSWDSIFLLVFLPKTPVAELSGFLPDS